MASAYAATLTSLSKAVILFTVLKKAHPAQQLILRESDRKNGIIILHNFAHLLELGQNSNFLRDKKRQQMIYLEIKVFFWPEYDMYLVAFRYVIN